MEDLHCIDEILCLQKNIEYWLFDIWWESQQQIARFDLNICYLFCGYNGTFFELSSANNEWFSTNCEWGSEDRILQGRKFLQIQSCENHKIKSIFHKIKVYFMYF